MTHDSKPTQNLFRVGIASVVLLFTNCKAPEPVVIKVPVPVPCPEPPARRTLTLPIDSLPPTADDSMKAGAILSTIKYLRLRVEELELILDGYRSRPDATAQQPRDGK